MKTYTPTPQKTLILPLAAGLLSMLFISAGTAHAQLTWDGSTDNTWNDGTNWDTNTPPATGDLLIFEAGTEATLNNDVTADTQLQIRITGDGYDLTGNRITLNSVGSVIRQMSGSGTNTISLDILDTVGDTRITTDAGTLNLAGALTGGVNLVTSGGGTLYLKNTGNDYDWTTIVSGTVAFDNGTLGTGDIRLGWNTGNGRLEYKGSGDETVSNIVQIGGNNTHTGGGIISNNSADSSTLTFTGTNFNTVDAAGVTRNIEFNGASDIEVQGVIRDNDNPVTLTKDGTNTLTLSGANTYTGETTISTGTVKLTNASGLGTTAGATTVASGATLEWGSLNVTEDITISGTGVGGTEGAIKMTGNTSGSELNSTVTLAADATINNTARFDHAGTVTDGIDSFTLTKKGSGQHRAQFHADFAHLVIAEGEYELAGNLALPSDTVTVNTGARLDIWRGLDLTQTGHTPTITFDDGSKFNWRGNNVNDTASIGGAMVLNGTVDFEVGGGNGKQITVESDISGTGNLNFTRLASTSGTMILSGANSYSGNTTINSGVLEIGGTGTLGSGTYAGAIAFTGSATLDYNTSADQTLSGNITGAGKFQQNGSGTTTLSGANAYNGATNVNAGTLSLASGYTHTGTGAYTVQGGTLKIADGVDISTHAMTISLGGVISPGNSPGTAITGAQTWNDGGSYLWEINDMAGTKGDDSGWDWLDIQGTLDINATFDILITSLDLSNNSGLADGFDTTGLSYLDPYASFTIATATGGVTGFDASAFNLIDSSFLNPKVGWSISLDEINNDIVLNAFFVPEPSSTALLGLGGLALMLRRKRS